MRIFPNLLTPFSIDNIRWIPHEHAMALPGKLRAWAELRMGVPTVDWFAGPIFIVVVVAVHGKSADIVWAVARYVVLVCES
jgi:hypothetical protein